jgi:osmotically inducible protein OsmC
MAEIDEIHGFEVAVTWSGDALGSGQASVQAGQFPVPIAGATSLGGSGGKANPEELLLAALGACFVNTWAIFIKKLGIAHPDPSVRIAGEVEKDPAGGYRMKRAVVHVRVPAALLEQQRAQVDKSIALTEKYCIISKTVRAAMPLEIVVEGI